MTVPEYFNDSEKEILELLDALPLEAGIPLNLRELLQQVGQSLSMKIARDLLSSTDEKKKSHGKKIAVLIDPERNVDLILPLLDESNPLLRWQTMYSVTRTRRFLEEDGIVVDRVIKTLLEDSSPMVRIEAADALGYCKITPRIVSALEYVRDHDFEIYDGNWAGSVAKESLKRIKERQNSS